MNGMFLNVDVPDVETAARFYVAAIGLRVGRRMGGDMIELLGAPLPIYLLEKSAGTTPLPNDPTARRTYARHWSPVHFDVTVDDLEPAVARAEAAGAVRESEITEHAYGRMALFADPFGHGLCLLEMNDRGYDAITTVPTEGT